MGGRWLARRLAGPRRRQGNCSCRWRTRTSGTSSVSRAPPGSSQRLPPRAPERGHPDPARQSFPRPADDDRCNLSWSTSTAAQRSRSHLAVGASQRPRAASVPCICFDSRGGAPDRIVHTRHQAANIMVHLGRAVKATHDSASPRGRGTPLTGSGVHRTPPYIPPEQLQGLAIRG